MRASRILVSIAVLMVQLPAFALFKASDHPVIKPMPGSHLVQGQSQMRNFASHRFDIQEGKRKSKVEKKGKYWHLRYRIKDANGKVDRNVSWEEIVQNYKEAALEKGGEIHAEKSYIMSFSLPRNDGGRTWARLVASNGSYNLDIIDEAAFKRQLTFGADEMKRQLDEKGHVAIYGINFDVDKASLKLGAEKVLIEMVKLMKRNPDLAIEIQGHTDDTGSSEHNLELSERRAGTVKDFLLTYGVMSQRMVAKGYGEEKPVAPNDTDENRALNRRVELVTLQ